MNKVITFIFALLVAFAFTMPAMAQGYHGHGSYHGHGNYSHSYYRGHYNHEYHRGWDHDRRYGLGGFVAGAIIGGLIVGSSNNSYYNNGPTVVYSDTPSVQYYDCRVSMYSTYIDGNGYPQQYVSGYRIVPCN